MWPIIKVFLNLLRRCFGVYLYIYFGHKARGILAVWPGIKPTSSALESLTTVLPGKSIKNHLNLCVRISKRSINHIISCQRFHVTIKIEFRLHLMAYTVFHGLAYLCFFDFTSHLSLSPQSCSVQTIPAFVRTPNSSHLWSLPFLFPWPECSSDLCRATSSSAF